MLVHSADNYADLLATWDAGSIPAFVAKMNADGGPPRHGTTRTSPMPAASIPARSRRPRTCSRWRRSTWPNPTFAAFVQMSSITLPVAGTISTYTPLLGMQGVIGVKSGFTSQAGGGDVLAVDRTVDGKQVLLLAAVTGQTGPIVLAQAGLHALALVDAMAPLIGSTQVLPGNQVVAHVSEAGHAGSAPRPRRRPPCSPGPASAPRGSSCRHGRCRSRPAVARRSGPSSSPSARQKVAVPVRLAAGHPAPDASPAPVLTA